MAMTPTLRLNRKRNNTSAADLVALMPDELRSFQIGTDMTTRTGEISTWLHTQTPKHGQHMLTPVMGAAGLTFLAALRDRLTQRQGE